MTDEEKKALIKKLGAESNKAFDSHYSGANRKWFVGKIVASLIAQGFTDKAVVEAKTAAIIKGAGDALKARIKKGFSAGGLLNKWSLYDQLTSRTQIIYGMIAMHPRFLEPANASYFDFILERRYTSIQRMVFYVNPNDERNVFAYPGQKSMKVNKDATASPAHWIGAAAGKIPFVLTAHGKAKPVDAVSTLFNSNKGDDRNLFTCDPVATILHLDALNAAKNADTLLTALAAVGEHYLKIDHPDGHLGTYLDGQLLVGVTSAQASAGGNVQIELGRIGDVVSLMKLSAVELATDNFFPFPGTDNFIIVEGVQDRFEQETFKIAAVNPVKRRIRVGTLSKSFGPGAKVYLTKVTQTFYATLPQHFLTDTRPHRGLFEQLTVKAEDLQVGDHIYVFNHPIYRLFYPGGIWGGEHSFISEIGSRDTTASVFRNEIKVEGHGIKNTPLLGMIDELLEWNNTVLAIMAALAKKHLGNLEKNGRPSTDTTVNANGFKFKFLKKTENGESVNVFEYDIPYEYSVLSGGKLKPFKKTAGFVIKEPANAPDTEFRIWSHEDKDSVTVKGKPLVASFTGTGAGERFKLSKWAVKFFNVRLVKSDVQPLFKSDNKTPNLLTFDDVARSQPFFTTDDKGDVYVTRPRVDFTAAYQTFLKTNGAI